MAKNACRDWEIIKRVTSLDIAAIIGKKLNSLSFGGNTINSPTGLALDEGKIVVINHYQKAYRFSSDWSIDKIYPIPVQDPTDSNQGISYSFGIDFDRGNAPDETTKVSIASWSRHLVRIYDKLTGQKLFQIGEYNDPGNVIDGKLRYPRRAIWLPNGNLLICSHQGIGDGGTGDGHLSEYDGSTGNFIATRLKYYSDGDSAIGKDIIYRPIDAKLHDGFLWVSEFGRNRILKINIDSWLVEDIFYAPHGSSINGTWAITITNDSVLVCAANSLERLVGIDLNTRSLAFEIPLCSGNFRDVIEISPGYLAVTEWNSKALYVVPTIKNIQIAYEPYTIPDGFEIAPETVLDNYDLTNNLLTVDVDKLDCIPEQLVINYRVKC